jgi:hypothetical protein
VTVVLVSPAGEVAGALPPFEVETPYWMQVGEVVSGVRERHGMDITVLRLLDATGDPTDEYGMGGDVVYLAEVETAGSDEKRADYARPGGPAKALAWADGVLADRGTPRVGRAEQERSWNLSGIWRLPLAGGGAAWLKVVPPFFAHEGGVIRLLQDSGVVPPLLGTEGGRVLLGDVPGTDQYGAPVELLGPMVDALVRLQVAFVGRVDSLLATGANDWRPAAFIPAAQEVVRRDGAPLPADERRSLARLLEGLEGRFAALAECGVPETLVHGDFHPGNVRSDGQSLVLLDWGDSGVGHPLFDMPAFLERVPHDHEAAIVDRWVGLWTDAVPGSDPRRAAELIAPVAALRQAMIYRMFLDNIEASEQRYHLADVPIWLSKAAARFSSRSVF